jgi:hypothetical protein
MKEAIFISLFLMSFTVLADTSEEICGVEVSYDNMLTAHYRESNPKFVITARRAIFAELAADPDVEDILSCDVGDEFAIVAVLKDESFALFYPGKK